MVQLYVPILQSNFLRRYFICLRNEELIVTTKENIPVILSLRAYTFLLSRYLRQKVECLLLIVNPRNCDYQHGEQLYVYK